jgi:5-methylcytosine-specific restriction protein A
VKPGKPLKRTTPLKAAKALQRKTPLQFSKPLEAKTPLARSSVPLKRAPMVQSRPKPKLTPAQKKPLLDRSGGVCEIQASVCGYIATDVCHRRGEKSGGRHGEAAIENDRLSNCLHGCRPCHQFAGLYPKTALMNGWRLLENGDPLTTRVYRRGEWVFLDDSGGFRRAA